MRISPMFFYAVHVTSAASDVLSICGMIAMIVGGIAVAMTMGDKDIRSARAWKDVFFAGVAALTVGMLLPDRDTMVLMQAAKMCAGDDPAAVFDGLKAVMDYAAEILK